MERNNHDRVGLSALEAGWLLEKTEGEVRGMLKRGELAYAVAGKKVCPESVAGLLTTGLQSVLLRSLLAGRVVAPRPERRYGPPAALWEAFDQLCLFGPTLMVDPASGETRILPAREQQGQRTGRSLIPVITFAM
jgi:hypothetical protein